MTRTNPYNIAWFVLMLFTRPTSSTRMTTTVKLIACLAMFLPTGYEASAGITSPKDANKLSISPPTDHETQILRTADAAFTVANEEKTYPLRSVIRADPVPHALRVQYPPRLIKKLVRSKYANWLFQGTHPTNAHKQLKEELPEEEQVDWYNEYTALFAKLYDGHDNDLFKNMEKFKKRLHELESHEDIDILIKLHTQSMEYWKQGMIPDEVYRLFGEPEINTIKHKVYLDYQRTFNDRQSYVRLKYFNWYNDKTSPAKAQKQLKNEFPGEEQMMTRYYQEYQKLYEVDPVCMRGLKERLEKGNQLPSVVVFLNKQRIKTALSNDVSTLLLDVCRLLIRERKLKQWMHDKEAPENVFLLLKLGKMDSSKRLASEEYQTYLRYYEWWCYTYPKEAVEKWKKDRMMPRDIFYLLKFDLKQNFTKDKMYDFFYEYIIWWYEKN